MLVEIFIAIHKPVCTFSGNINSNPCETAPIAVEIPIKKKKVRQARLKKLPLNKLLILPTRIKLITERIMSVILVAGSL